MPLTAAIYAEDGTINWSDLSIRDTIFAHGAETFSLENYVFIYDVYKLRTIVNSSNLRPDQKKSAAHVIAKQVFTKHIDRGLKDPVRYSVYHSNIKSDVNSAINIGDELYQKFALLVQNINQKSSIEIMNLFESAICEITPSLGLPKRNSKRLPRQREYSGVVYATQGSSSSRGSNEAAFLLFTPASSAVTPVNSQENINWARPEQTNTTVVTLSFKKKK